VPLLCLAHFSDDDVFAANMTKKGFSSFLSIYLIYFFISLVHFTERKIKQIITKKEKSFTAEDGNQGKESNKSNKL